MPLEAGFHLHRSNRTEQLLDALAQVVSRPVGGGDSDPLAPETIVVQGQGMGRWLSMALARKLGVWARPDFRPIRELLDECADLVLGPDSQTVAGESPFFQTDTLTFAMADTLLELVGLPEFASVAGYLEGDVGGRRLMQLAERLAQIFDGYATQRPDWLASWAEGRVPPELAAELETATWQARLWRTLVDRGCGQSHDTRMRALRVALDGASGTGERLPRRISVFGLSSLTPSHTDVLRAIAGHVPVHVFLLAPTDAWWADLRSLREQWRAARRDGVAVAASADERAAIEGHPLLAAFGRLGRDFQQTLESGVDYLDAEDAVFVDPREAEHGERLLCRLQSRMLRLEGRGSGGEEPPRAIDDDSLRVHVCHSPLREVEVLHDQLLDLFERDASLEPKDVVVMSPDIERHAPLIEAVFGSRGAQGGRPLIPHRIADRSIVVTREGVAAFLQILDGAAGRLPAAAVLDLLRVPSVAGRYGLDAASLGRLDQWVARAGIRWGLDASHRASEGLPEQDLHTWRYGLDRLLLGVAMDPGEDEPWEGCLAVAGLEGEDARVIGALACFISDLAWARVRLHEEHTPGEWADLFRELDDRFIAASDDNAHHHQDLRDAFAALEQCARQAGFERRLGLAAMKSLLMRSLRASTPSYGFLSGGVTFCEMVPMRSIPFRVVCMLGLDDGAFPRNRRALGFDLMARAPRLGDRTTRDDDRSLFLEALLSARDHLVLTHVGRDIRDAEPRPSSVVVTELLDAVRDELGVLADDELTGWLIHHPLKAFSPRYFTSAEAEAEAEADEDAEADGSLFSYDAAALRGARALVEPEKADVPGFTRAADRHEEAAGVPEQLEIVQLQGFLRRASRGFLRDRIGVRVDSPEAPERDREPAGLEGLARWEVGEAVLRGLLEGWSEERIRRRLHASGMLPSGELGERSFADVAREARRLAQKQVELCDGLPPTFIDVDLALGGVHLVGRIEGITDRGRVRSGYAKLGGTAELDAWVEHLALCATRGGETGCDTTLIGRIDGSTTLVRFMPVEHAREQLEDLVEIWLAGWSRPLPIFPRTARVYIEKRGDLPVDDPDAERLEDQAIQNAYREFRGDDTGYDLDRCESEREADIRYLWRGRDPLERVLGEADGDVSSLSFRSLSRRIYGPLRAARVEES